MCNLKEQEIFKFDGKNTHANMTGDLYESVKLLPKSFTGKDLNLQMAGSSVGVSLYKVKVTSPPHFSTSSKICPWMHGFQEIHARKSLLGKELGLQGVVKGQSGMMGAKRYHLPFVSTACLPLASHNARLETSASRRIKYNSTRDLRLKGPDLVFRFDFFEIKAPASRQIRYNSTRDLRLQRKISGRRREMYHLPFVSFAYLSTTSHNDLSTASLKRARRNYGISLNYQQFNEGLDSDCMFTDNLPMPVRLPLRQAVACEPDSRGRRLEERCR